MAFSDYEYALKFRNVVKQICTAEIDKIRPRHQYATVMTIDRNIRKCTVRYPGDTVDVAVNMGALQPSAAGQVVRINGIQGDRFIDDVLGRTFFVEDSDVRLITTSYTSKIKSPPLAPVGNTAGTALQTLTIPAVSYSRLLDVRMTCFLGMAISSDTWEMVGTYDGNSVAVNVLDRSRYPSPTSSCTGHIDGLVTLDANVSIILRVWVRRIAGTGGANGSVDHTYTNINCITRGL